MTTCPFKKAIAVQEILRGGGHTVDEGLAWFEHIEVYLECDEALHLVDGRRVRRRSLRTIARFR